MLLADEQLPWNGTFGLFDSEALWALSNQLGSVRDLVDNSGTVRKHTSYDAFGRIVDEAF